MCGGLCVLLWSGWPLRAVVMPCHWAEPSINESTISPNQTISFQCFAINISSYLFTFVWSWHKDCLLLCNKCTRHCQIISNFPHYTQICQNYSEVRCRVRVGLSGAWLVFLSHWCSLFLHIIQYRLFKLLDQYLSSSIARIQQRNCEVIWWFFWALLSQNVPGLLCL